MEKINSTENNQRWKTVDPTANRVCERVVEWNRPDSVDSNEWQQPGAKPR